MFDGPYSRTLEAKADSIGLQLAAKGCVGLRASSAFGQWMGFAESFHGHSKCPEWLSTHSSHGNEAGYVNNFLSQAHKIRSVIAHYLLDQTRLLFELRVNHFLEESEKEDLNITVKKQKMDTLPIQK